MPEALSGLSVTNPSAWWAMLALGIPLIIHLFSKSRGRLVRIGHIDLIRQARKLQVTELKLTQWLLLLLRLAIFTLAGLILAGLATAGLNSNKANSIYLTPGWLSNAGTPEISALLENADQTANSRFYLLQPGFPTIDRKQLETNSPQVIHDTAEPSNTWALLSERLSLEHHLGEVTVYTTDHMLQFGLYKPALPRPVNWQIASPEKFPVIDSKAIRALIVFDPERAADAKRLGTALSVLKQHRLPNLAWEQMDASQTVNSGDGLDWLILLGDRVIEPALIETFGSPKVIFTDSAGTAAEHETQFIKLPFYPFSRFRLEHYDRPVVKGNESVLLTTASGSPILQESYYGETRVLQFNSRINPQWSSIAQQPGFPELLLQLMSDSKQDRERYANARLSKINLQNSGSEAMTKLPLPRRSLQGLLAAMLAFLWVIERWLSERISRDRR
jgi:hypothetical protein